MWLSRLRRLVNGNARKTRGAKARRRRGSPPKLEHLEDRTLLSLAFTVNMTSDGITGGTSSGTLRDGIIATNNDTTGGADSITLSAGTYTLSIANSSSQHENAARSGDLNITNTSHTLTIQGATDPTTGKPTTIIDQTVADRVFQIVNPGTTVTFKNLIIEGGNAQDNGTAGAAAGSTTAEGGGLLNNGGNVTMTNVALSVDFATGGTGQSAQGGGIYSLNGTLTLNNVTLSVDAAFGGSNGGSAQGAGLYLSGGKANLNNGKISANSLSAGSGATGGNAQGGGIYANAATLTLTGGSVNTATVRAGNSTSAGGNAGNADGGGVFATQSTVTIQGGATINANTITGGIGGNGANGSPGINGGLGGTGGLAQGGGVYVHGGQLTITGASTTVTNNTATGGIGGKGGVGGKAAVGASAGAIGGQGGAGAEADGGGVHALAAPVTINGGAVVNANSDFGGAGGHGGTGGAGASGNQNGGAGGAGGAGGQAQGGGLFASGTNLAVALGNSTTTATINTDTATGGAAGNGGLGGAKAVGGTGIGGAGGAAGAGGSGTGGGATIFGDKLTLTNAIFSGDDLLGGNAGRGGTGKSGGAGAAGGMGGSAQGGGLFVSSSASATILNSTIYSNEALAKRGGTGAAGGAGGGGGTGGNGQGGGLYAVSSTVNAYNSTFADNIAIAGTEGVNAANSPSGNGGAGQGAGIYAATGSLTLTNDTIAWNFLKSFTDRNAQPGQGAGVYNASNDTLKLENTIIAKDELFSTSTNLNSITPSDLSGNAASSDRDFIGDGAGSNLINGTNGDQVGSDTSPLDPQFLPPVTTVFGLSGQVPGNYGGLTPTLALNWTSAAINGGDPGAAAAIANAEGVVTSSATDQRGFARVVDGTIDIGATETQLTVDGSATATVQTGSNITYTLTVTNGETTAVGVTLSDTLPANTTFQSFTAPSGWTVSTPAVGATGTVTASIGSLAANTSATFTLVVQVSSSAQGGSTIANTATITTSGVNPTFSRSATFDTTVAGSTTNDITNEIGIRQLPVHPDPDDGPNAFEQMVILVNNSGTTLTGPIALVLTGLPAGVTLTNATGMFNGSPYIDIVPANGSWKPGQSHFLMPRLDFYDPSGVPITWTAQIIQGI